MKRTLIEILIYIAVFAVLYGICYGLCRAYVGGVAEMWEEVETG